MRSFSALIIPTLLSLFVPSAHGQTDNGKISGLMFGDYYYVISNHDAGLEDESGFWFRRIYFTYDKGLGDEFATRLRFEAQSAGDFSSSTSLEPFVKDAYLKWKRGHTQVLLGLSPSPAWGHTVEKT